MSHEIRTPISAIIGMTDIAMNTDDIARKDNCLDKIEKASKHLLGIVNQILDISKIEAGQFELDLHAFQFDKMVEEIASVLSFSVDEKQLDLEIELDRTMPRFIVSDKVRLAQVLTNLLTNAVKFTPEGGKISLKVHILTDKEENIMRVEVADTGIGIPRELRLQLFGDFVQLESGASRKFGGTGLGLAISKRIVEMMGGSIWVESEPGEGSRFIFEIPVGTGGMDDEDSRIAYSDAEAGGAEPNSFKGYTILVAEDVEINREIVSALLEPIGLIIEYAFDGAEAIQMFADAPGRYDIIFMDIQMPGVDGLTATRRIRELDTARAKSIPIVAMTANVFREDIDACLEAGMNDHLGKPLDLGQIMAKLRLYL
jgi:CheY-like chemotaxis protein/two-component sensor histidine kinase